MPFTRRYPQTMLRVRMRETARQHSVETRRAFADEAKEIQQREGSLRAIGYLLDKVGVGFTVDRDEGYCAEALNFHLGLLDAYSDRPEAMAEHIRLSRTMPGPRG